MDSIQTGKMIAELRKQKGLTQQQLADLLNLSNKTISKWESGAGSPDIANLPPLADELGVSVDELLRGKPNEPKTMPNSISAEKEGAAKGLQSAQRKERAMIALAAAIGAIFGILAYNLGWLG